LLQGVEFELAGWLLAQFSRLSPTANAVPERRPKARAKQNSGKPPD
jgi:hypothetical protein